MATLNPTTATGKPRGGGASVHGGDADWVLNIRLLIATAVIIGVVAPSAFYWHRKQVRGNAAVFLEQADRAEKKNDFKGVAQSLASYLQLRPGDAKARVRLAWVFDKLITSPQQFTRANDLFTEALVFAPDDRALRKRRAELALSLGRHQAVVDDVEVMLKADAEDTDAIRLRALVYDLIAHTTHKIAVGEAIAALETAVKRRPADAELASRLAMLYLNETAGASPEKRRSMAAELMDNLVAQNSNDPQALLARYYFRDSVKLTGADDDLDAAYALAPENLDVLIAVARRAGIRHRGIEARETFTKALAAAPNDPRPYMGLAETYAERGAFEKAIEIWRDGLNHVGRADLGLNLRLAEGLLAANRLDELSDTVAVLSSYLKQNGTSMGRSSKLKLDGRINYFQGRLLMANGKLLDALPHLQRSVFPQQVALETRADTHEIMTAAYYLAECLAALGQWDLSVAALEEALKYSPRDPKYLLAIAHAYEQTGRFDQAIKCYEQALTLPQTALPVWVTLARVHYRKQVSLPAAGRDWIAFHQAFERARMYVPDSVDLKVLEADFATIQGQQEEALANFRKAQESQPNSEGVARALVLAYEQFGQQAQADEALAEYERRSSKSPTSQILRATVLARRGQEAEASKLLEKVATEVDGLQRKHVISQMAQLSLRTGRVDEARKLIGDLARENTEDLELLQAAAELALDARDINDMKQWEALLERREGTEQGTLWRYFRAQRLVHEAIRATDTKFIEATKLQLAIERLRPMWPDSLLLKGQLAQMQNARSEAIDAYQSAIYYGDARMATYERLIRLLYDDGRFAEAERYLSKMRDVTAAQSDFSEVAISLMAQRGQVGRAIQLAQENLALKRGDPMSMVWLGQALTLAGRTAEARQVFGKAVESAPRDVRTWFALLGFLARQDQIDEARQMLAQMEQGSFLAENERAFTLAQGYEMIDDGLSAERLYRDALRKGTDNPRVLRRVAAFFMGRDNQLAEQALRGLMAIEPNSADVHRSLILMLANRGGEQEWLQISSLLDQLNTSAQGTPDDIRLRVRLLVQHGSASDRRKAKELLERLVSDSNVASGEDRLQLARLNEVDGNLRQAREQLLSLVSVPRPEPAALVEFIDLLLRHDHAAEASQWLEKLEGIAPKQPQTVFLRARWLIAQSRQAEVEPLLDAFGKQALTEQSSAADRAGLARSIGQLYATAELDAQAQHWFELAVENDPESLPALIDFLLDRGHADAALEIAFAAIDKNERPAAVAIAKCLARGTADPVVAKKAEAQMVEILAKNESSPELNFAVGNLRYVEGADEEAIKNFRRVLALDSDHAPAMAKLAVLLSEQAEHQTEALQLVDRAMTVAGKQDEYLDVRGQVLLNTGKTLPAIQALEQAALGAKPKPEFHFHLALAYQSAGKALDARKALRNARLFKLDPHMLRVRERLQLAKLEEAL